MSTKNEILKLFENNKDRIISGQEMGELLNVSRSAVWKAVRELQKDGYMITGVTNNGYRFSTMNDKLSAEGIESYLDKSHIDCKIQVFKSVDSTNIEAKILALGGAENGTIILAEEQKNGRGRMGRSFYSPPDSGIYMSMVLRPRIALIHSTVITIAAVVAICRAIQNKTGIETKIKWVNDIFLNDKKICGILTEASSNFENGDIEYIVLGIGINYSTESEKFPSELKQIAGSLYERSDKRITRNELIAEIIKEIYDVIKDINDRNFIVEYKKRSNILGRTIQTKINGSIISAKAVDINKDGALIIKLPNGELKTLYSGEVNYKGELNFA